MLRKYFLLALLAAGGVLCSCSKTDFQQPGQKVRFQATHSSLKTKATYPDLDKNRSGEVWWEWGDCFRFYSNESPTPESHFADYYAETPDPVTGKTRLFSSDGLTWGGGTQTFYGVFPSPNTPGKESDSIGKTDESDCVLLGHIPEEQTIVSDGWKKIGSTLGYFTQPDMTSQYLVGKAVASETPDPVSLQFKSISTAVRFVIKNGAEGINKLMQIDGVSLESANHYLSGTFSADLAGWDPDSEQSPYPVCTEMPDVKKSKKVYIDFGEYGLSANPGEVIAFTLFMSPVSDLDDLTLSLMMDNGRRTASTLLKKNGVPFNFKRSKLTYASMTANGDSLAHKVVVSLDDLDVVNTGILEAILAFVDLNDVDFVRILEILSNYDAATYDPAVFTDIANILLNYCTPAETVSALAGLMVGEALPPQVISSLSDYIARYCRQSGTDSELAFLNMGECIPAEMMALLYNLIAEYCPGAAYSNFIENWDSQKILALMSISSLANYLSLDLPRESMIADIIEVFGIDEVKASQLLSALEELPVSDMERSSLASSVIAALLTDTLDSAHVIALLADYGISPDSLSPVADALAGLDLGTVIDNSSESLPGYDVIPVK